MTHISNVNLNCMVDLETMSTASDAAIVSIGAVLFSQEQGILDTFYANICLQSCIDAGLRLDGDTVMFWLRQSEDARKALYNGDKLYLINALLEFNNWLKENSDIGTVKVWGNGASFDNSILATAYRQLNVQQPWKFWNDRCYRTIKNLYPDVELQRVGELHNALDDAKSQALHLLTIAKQKGVDL